MNNTVHLPSEVVDSIAVFSLKKRLDVVAKTIDDLTSFFAEETEPNKRAYWQSRIIEELQSQSALEQALNHYNA
jgi:hypothetical protein